MIIYQDNPEAGLCCAIIKILRNPFKTPSITSHLCPEITSAASDPPSLSFSHSICLVIVFRCRRRIIQPNLNGSWECKFFPNQQRQTDNDLITVFKIKHQFITSSRSRKKDVGRSFTTQKQVPKPLNSL